MQQFFFLSLSLTLLVLMKTKDTCIWWSSFRGRIANELTNNMKAWKVVATCGLLISKEANMGSTWINGDMTWHDGIKGVDSQWEGTTIMYTTLVGKLSLARKHIFEWLWKRTRKRHACKRDWIVCTKYDNTILDLWDSSLWHNLYKIFTRFPKPMRKK